MNVPEVTRERVFTQDQNGDFSRRVIDALFRLATMDSTRIFAVLRVTTYLHPTVKAPPSCYQLFGHSSPFPGGRGRSSRATRDMVAHRLGTNYFPRDDLHESYTNGFSMKGCPIYVRTAMEHPLGCETGALVFR